MGMDATAYLWFGSKPITECDLLGGKPIDESNENVDRWDNVEELDGELSGTGVALVQIPSYGDHQFALCVDVLYHDHDWDHDSKPFDITQPTPADRELIMKVATEIGWPVSVKELGWYMAATYY
jgi:hypothetical protein